MKPSLLYFSPYPPHKSGIADYSVDLVKALEKHYELTLCLEPPRLINPGLYEIVEKDLFAKISPEIFEKYRIIQFGLDAIRFDSYDFIIYNFGNNPHFHSYMYDLAIRHPGLIILHEYVLYFLTVGRYFGNWPRFFRAMYRVGGLKAVWLQFRLLFFYRRHPLHCPFQWVQPLNSEILNSKNRFMVHSHYLKRKIESSFPHQSGNTKVIKMIATTPSTKSSESELAVLKEKYQIKPNSLIISSFGFIADTKLNHVVAEAVAKLKSRYPQIVYLMVGEGGYIDDKVDGITVFKTGYVNLAEFGRLIQLSDIVVNLRNPSMGETSSSLIRILQEGKPCIISDDGWFSEIPAEAVIKISNHECLKNLETQLDRLIQSPDLRSQFSEAAKKLIETQHSPEQIALQIKTALETPFGEPLA